MVTTFAKPAIQSGSVDPDVIGIMQQNLNLMGKILDGNTPVHATKMYRKAVGNLGTASLFHGTGSIGADARAIASKLKGFWERNKGGIIIAKQRTSGEISDVAKAISQY
jgi:hypothetical protein